MTKESQRQKGLKIDISNICKVLQTQDPKYINKDFVKIYKTTTLKIRQDNSISIDSLNIPKLRTEKLELFVIGIYVIVKIIQLVFLPDLEKLERIFIPLLTSLLFIFPFKIIRRKILKRKMLIANETLKQILDSIYLR